MLMLLLSAHLLSAPDNPPLAAPAAAPKPVAATREEMKELLEQHKKARPRLPLPPADPNGTQSVNNARYRAYYLPDFSNASGFSREPDPAMTLDNTFKVKLFWIASRTNNCYYCMGHQELKLRAANLVDDEIATLDGDWAALPLKEQAAFAFTRKITLTPQRVGPEDIKSLTAHYKPREALEILITVAGYNSTNRWTDGLNIPAEDSGEFFKKGDAKGDFGTFKTPTSPKLAERISRVAPLPEKCVKASPPSVPDRPALEAREQVEARWKEARSRTALLPLAEDDAAKELWDGDAAPNWVRLLAVFPKAGKSRVAGLRTSLEKGKLSPRLKAAIAWSTAREDRAWYALAVAAKRLKGTGLNEDQIFAIDTAKNELTERERLAVEFSRKLTRSGAIVSDADVEALRKVFTDPEVAEIVHHTCNAAFFNRVTEAANLPLD